MKVLKLSAFNARSLAYTLLSMPDGSTVEGSDCSAILRVILDGKLYATIEVKPEYSERDAGLEEIARQRKEFLEARHGLTEERRLGLIASEYSEAYLNGVFTPCEHVVIKVMRDTTKGVDESICQDCGVVVHTEKYRKD